MSRLETGMAVAMNGLSRRAFGRLAVGAGLAGAALGAGACGSKPAGPPTPASRPASAGGPGVGYVLSHEQFPTPALVDQAQAAEEAGFRYLWASDHLQPWQDDQGHAMFPWLTLALVGQRTKNIVYGTGVTCPIYRQHPAEVAQAFASLAVLTPNRVFLGLGTGERLNEQAATGQYGPYTERHDRMIEAIDLIRQLWSGQRISFAGRYFQTNSLKIYDLPAAPPPSRIRSWQARSTMARDARGGTRGNWRSASNSSRWSANRTRPTGPPLTQVAGDPTAGIALYRDQVLPKLHAS
jgi:TAT-translocated FGD2 family F420-dependent dehydrogenase